jgi:hypothetical protein
MILLLLWAFSGMLLGYEAARHGIVQVVVPALYLLAMFAWTIIGLCLAWYVSRKGARPRPSAREVSDAWAALSQRDRERIGKKPWGK